MSSDAAVLACVVCGDGQGAAVRGAGRAGELGDVVGQDVVERLDQCDAVEVPLNQLAGGQLLVVELRDPAISGRVVVAGIEHGLAVQRRRADRGIRSERHRQHNEVPGLGRLLSSAGGGQRP
jgi:hypothetical protein